MFPYALSFCAIVPDEFRDLGLELRDDVARRFVELCVEVGFGGVHCCDRPCRSRDAGSSSGKSRLRSTLTVAAPSVLCKIQRLCNLARLVTRMLWKDQKR